MTANDLVQALLDGINLPGYGEDPDSNEFDSLIDSEDRAKYENYYQKIREIRRQARGKWDVLGPQNDSDVKMSYIKLDDALHQVNQAIRLTIEDEGAVNLFGWMLEGIQQIPALLESYGKYDHSLDAQVNEVLEWFKSFYAKYRPRLVGEAINLPGYDDEPDPNGFSGIFLNLAYHDAEVRVKPIRPKDKAMADIKAFVLRSLGKDGALFRFPYIAKIAPVEILGVDLEYERATAPQLGKYGLVIETPRQGHYIVHGDGASLIGDIGLDGLSWVEFNPNGLSSVQLKAWA